MRFVSSGFVRPAGLVLLAALAAALPQAALADVLRPASVAGVTAEPLGLDVVIGWDPVTEDVNGNPETLGQYHVYRGEDPDFTPDRIGGTNRIGTVASESFVDVGAAAGPVTYFYLVSAVDAAGNESDPKPSRIGTPPVLGGFWTNSSIVVDWTDAEPLADVASYKVYWGDKSGQYEFAQDVALNTTYTIGGLTRFKNWYIGVAAVDSNGYESAFSNEHIDAVAGVVRHSVHDTEELCWGGGCVPLDPAKIQRNGGWQILVPTHFPEGDWVKATMTFTMESRLCTPPTLGTVSKCGPGNPCVSPPCNGGYNPCGDPWDRTAHVFLVLDDCVDTGGSCITPNNLELMRAITPFGTDAPAPDGSGTIPPRALTLDVTPLVPLLAGDRYLGVEIGHFVQTGHWVSVDFEFSERPEQASPKPPADGIEIVGFGGPSSVNKQVTIPASATEVKMRLFTTGHGGSTFCDGGANNANPCTSGVDCPGGVCNPCDEFCHRTNQILANGAPIWEVAPWRTDCSPAGNSCSNWNACGFPSCTFPRAGWCPGYMACHENDPCDNDLDFTSELPAGGTYDFGYNVLQQNGSWTIGLVLYWYE